MGYNVIKVATLPVITAMITSTAMVYFQTRDQ